MAVDFSFSFELFSRTTKLLLQHGLQVTNSPVTRYYNFSRESIYHLCELLTYRLFVYCATHPRSTTVVFRRRFPIKTGNRLSNRVA